MTVSDLNSSKSLIDVLDGSSTFSESQYSGDAKSRNRSESRAAFKDLSDLEVVRTVGGKLRQLQRKIIRSIQTDITPEVGN
jgi:hypothetical protein